MDPREPTEDIPLQLLTSVIWAVQDPRSPTCDFCGEFRPLRSYIWWTGYGYSGGVWEECRCEARRLASRPQREEGS